MMCYLRYYTGFVAIALGTLGFILGGHWVWLGASTLLMLLVLELALPEDIAVHRIRSVWLADLPLHLHLLSMIALYGAFLWRMRADGAAMPFVDLVGCTLTLAWHSIVPNVAVHHEFMHGRYRLAWPFSCFLGALHGDPMRGISHVHGHHLHLGTPRDSDTAWRGETIYTFMFRATWGAYRDAIRGERMRMRRTGRSLLSVHCRLVHSAAMIAAIVAVAAWLGGALAALVTVAAMATAKLLLEAFNYYQHYGLVRVEGTPIEARHIWNHLNPAIRAMSFEISNHTGHHIDSYVPYHQLVPDPEAPRMPSIVLCFLAGFIPPLWFRFIAMPHLRHWDEHFATADERRLAAAANAAAGWPSWLTEIPAGEQQRSLG